MGAAEDDGAFLFSGWQKQVIHFMSQTATVSRMSLTWWKPALFFVVLIAGLWLVKWQPYYAKALLAADTHSIGNSLLAGLDSQPLASALTYAQLYFKAVWKAAVLGIVLGSLVQVLIPPAWLERTLGSERVGSTLFGTLFSLPGMMCTCCAAPVVAGLRKQSVSMGGALAFWLGNPLLNPATLIFMGFVLGWQFTLLRLVAAVVIVFLTAALVGKLVRDQPAEQKVTLVALQHGVEVPEGSFWQRWLRALWRLCLATIPTYVLAVLVLGAAQVWLFPHGAGSLGNGAGWLIAMTLAGTLFVIPTAAEIPISQALMAAGLGMGPAVALLVTLPALSLPSLLMLRKSFPAKALWLAAGVVTLVGLLTGMMAG